MKVDKLIKELSKDVLGCAFMVQALHQYSTEILSDSTDWGHSFINKEAWQAQAQHVQELLKENLHG